EISATAQGLGTTAPVSVVARPAATSREIKVVLETLAQVRGQVVMDGEPVAGAIVVARHDGKPIGRGRSQADGSFVVEAVPYGPTQFFVHPYRLEDDTQITVDRAVVDGVRLDVAK